MVRGRLARFLLASSLVLAALQAAFFGVLFLIGEGRLNPHRRVFLLGLPRLAVASHLSFGHWFDPLN